MAVAQHQDMDDRQVVRNIHQGIITLAGNKNLKIFGRLNCHSGRRMHKKNRIFFDNKASAIALGYRPCGHCMPEAYKKWKHETI